MSNLQEISDTLSQQIEDIQAKSKALSKLKGGQKQEAITKCQRQIKRTKNLLKTYEFTIQDSDNQPGVQGHKSQAKQYQSKLNQLEKGLEYSRSQGVNQQQLFKHRNVNKNDTLNSSNGGKSNQRQQMIQQGHRTQEQGMQALKRINQNVHIMDEQANAVGIQLDRQINQLDKIYDDLQDTQTTLKRAEQHLKYFARQVYTDKLMMCLIVVIILAIIVIIILSAIGMTPKVSIDSIK